MSFGDELMRQLDAAVPGGIRRGTPLQSDPASRAGVAARVRYIRSARYGAPRATVAKLAGVSTKTVAGWEGGALPTMQYRRAIDSIYRRFFAINERATLETLRRREAKKVYAANVRNALRVTNTDGDKRYYTPSYRYWPTLLALWIHGSPAGMDAVWSAIISSWDYPEPWDAAVITDVEIE